MLSININLLFNAINILVLCVLVKLFLLKPVHKILEKRQALVDDELAKAQSAKDAAAQLQLQQQESLKSVETEKMAVIAEAQKTASEEYNHLMTDAKKKAEAIVQKAESDAESRKQDVLRQTQREISGIIVSATEKLSAGGDGALYDEFLKKAGEADDKTS